MGNGGDRRDSVLRMRMRPGISLLLVLAISMCVAVPSLVASEASVSEETDASAESPDSETTEAETTTGTNTVEYLVPDGGYLTDPGIAQEQPRESALNRIFPLWKSVAGDHALPRPWSVGVVTYWQTQNYDIVSAAIGIEDVAEIDLDIEGSFAFVDAKSIGATLCIHALFAHPHATMRRVAPTQ